MDVGLIDDVVARLHVRQSQVSKDEGEVRQVPACCFQEL